MTIGLTDAGAIGRHVTDKPGVARASPQVVLVRSGRPDAADESAILRVGSVADLPSGIDSMVDCAGHRTAFLERSMDLDMVSLGALVDWQQDRKLSDAARSGNAQRHVASAAFTT